MGSNVLRQIGIEQNRCAMAYQGCGKAIFCYLLLKGSRKNFLYLVLLSYHTKQLHIESHCL